MIRIRSIHPAFAPAQHVSSASDATDKRQLREFEIDHRGRTYRLRIHLPTALHVYGGEIHFTTEKRF